MLYLLEFLDMVPIRVVGGDKYTWTCYGNDARYLDMERNVEIVFDEETEEIYEISIRDGGDNEHNTIWRNPKYEPAYLDEIEERRNLDKDELVSQKANVSTTNDIIDKVRKLYEPGSIF